MKIQPRFVLAAVIAFTSLAGPTLRAAEEAPATPAERLIKLMDFSTTALRQAKVTFAPILEQFRQQGIPEAGIKEISAAADRYFNSTFADPDMAKELAKIYSKSFTDKEIEELLAFYDTPIGRKSLSALPQVMSECTRVSQEFSKKNQPEFQREIAAIMTKYANPANGAAPGK